VKKCRKIILKYPTRTNQSVPFFWNPLINNPKTGTVVFAKQPERLYFSGQEVLGVQHPMHSSGIGTWAIPEKY
jgi:hypothetical protein